MDRPPCGESIRSSRGRPGGTRAAAAPRGMPRRIRTLQWGPGHADAGRGCRRCARSKVPGRVKVRPGRTGADRTAPRGSRPRLFPWTPSSSSSWPSATAEIPILLTWTTAATSTTSVATRCEATRERPADDSKTKQEKSRSYSSSSSSHARQKINSKPFFFSPSIFPRCGTQSSFA